MNIHRGIFGVVILLSSVVLGARAEESSTANEGALSLSEVVSLALANSPTVDADQARLRGAEERQAGARAEFKPRASFLVNATRFENPMIVTPIHGFTPDSTPLFDDLLIQGSFNVEMLLYDGKARRSAVHQTEALSEAAGQAVEEARSLLIAEAVAAYLNLQGSRAILDAQDRRLEALRVEQERVDNLYAVGRIAEVEVLRLEAAIARAEAERTLRETTLHNAERDLARLLGLEEERLAAEPLQVQRLLDAAPLPRPALLAAVRRDNWRVRQTQLRVEVAQAAVDAARSASKPTLGAVAGLTEYGSAEFDFTSEWQAALRFSMPLYTGGRTARKIAEAEAARDEATHQLLAVQRAVASSVDHALGGWEAARDREKSLEAAVRGFAAVAASEKLRLETGTGIPADFLDAEADLLDARASRVIAANAVILSRLELAVVLGELDEGWVARHVAEASRAAEAGVE